MIWTGHPRASRAVPARVRALAAVAMLLLVLAGSVLVSAGSPHHRPPRASATAVTAVHTEAGGAIQAIGHEHRHGNDWAPTLGKRLRPAAPATVVGMLPARPDEPGALPGTATSPARMAPGDRLISLSVLRV